MSTALVLFRRDLRLRDHPALSAACAAHSRILPLYVHAPQEEGSWSPGAASRWWLHHSLDALARELDELGGQLYIAVGDSLEVVRQMLTRSGAKAIYWTRRYEPTAIAQDTRLKQVLRADGTTVESHPGNLWREPWEIRNAEGRPYRVFSPFWRNLRAQLPHRAPLPAARAGEWLKLSRSLKAKDLDLLPRIRWDGGLAENWQPGEAGAHELLEIFAEGAAADYRSGRDRLAGVGTSRLSPHLHFGEITPVQIRFQLERWNEKRDPRRRVELEPFWRQLGWREFAHHLLYHFRHTPEANFDPRFDGFDWAPTDSAALQAWADGRTGIPLVDAGMRELWHTGWMHNRARMVVASFLTKNLRQHWLRGARWFWDTLVDADLANNTLGWQWVAGSGADAAPYYRIFNPYLQAKRFDPEARYLKRWLPELSDLPVQVLHEPWRDPVQLAARRYSPPLCDFATSREAALAAYQRLPRTAAVRET
jgi:deoxyribodipyrimidine photo-lyase